jgi:glyoxylase-like metal-dependent hydrolase (beta-lactamase superfamily II)
VRLKTLALFLLTLLSAGTAVADDRFANVKMTVQPLNGSVHMMVGSGGNIGVSAGEDGILMIDDQYAPLAEKIAAALNQLGSDKPRYIINTHYHGTPVLMHFFSRTNRLLYSHMKMFVFA